MVDEEQHTQYAMCITTSVEESNMYFINMNQFINNTLKNVCVCIGIFA